MPGGFLCPAQQNGKPEKNRLLGEPRVQKLGTCLNDWLSKDQDTPACSARKQRKESLHLNPDAPGSGRRASA